MDSEFQDLYQDIILDHNRSPRNFGKLDGATHVLDGRNPLCGDHYKLYFKIKDNIIEDVKFEGSGCAISKASASVMSASVKGKTVQEAESLYEIFHQIITGKVSMDDYLERVGKLAAFGGVSEFPVRVKCATLAWHTMHNAIQGDQAEVSTEE